MEGSSERDRLGFEKGNAVKIGLIDVDGHNFPNIPLMKLSAWHKAKGDHVKWYSPLLSGHCDIVYMAKVFSFSPEFPYPIDCDQLIRGGSGFHIELENEREVWHGQDDNLPMKSSIHILTTDFMG